MESEASLDGVEGAGTAAGETPVAVAGRPQRPLSPAARVLAHLGPDFTLLFLFAAVLLGLIFAYGASLVWNDGSIFISVSIGASLLGTRFLYRWRSIVSGVPGARADYLRAARVILRDWGPLILILFAFESLRSYTGMIRTTSIDDQLYQLDLRLFGVEPSVWMGKFAHPALTDWMTIAYGSYFILPMILATSLALRGRREDFRELSTAMLMQLAIGFLLFLIFPAGPPRYYAPLLDGGFHPAQLSSYSGLYELSTGALDAANPLTTRSSFPSLHCALGLCTLVYVHRFGDAVIPGKRRPFFWITLPIIVSLWVSTVYLRHHWIPDIAAGLLLGSIVVTITPHIRRRWPIFEPPAR
jgi:membrane-associated phospholipid phosphatase